MPLSFFDKIDSVMTLPVRGCVVASPGAVVAHGVGAHEFIAEIAAKRNPPKSALVGQFE